MNEDVRRLISSLEAQEERLVFTRFDNADAWRLGSAMVAAATERSLPVTVDIRRHGQQLFHAAQPGSTAANDAWIGELRRCASPVAVPRLVTGESGPLRGPCSDGAQASGREATRLLLITSPRPPEFVTVTG